jgi:hypothetical protein
MFILLRRQQQIPLRENKTTINNILSLFMELLCSHVYNANNLAKTLNSLMLTFAA